MHLTIGNAVLLLKQTAVLSSHRDLFATAGSSICVPSKALAHAISNADRIKTAAGGLGMAQDSASNSEEGKYCCSLRPSIQL